MTARSGREIDAPYPPTRMMGLLPSLVTTIPAIGIAAIDPAPRQSRRSPNAPSPIPSRALANGTRGAQHAIANPAAAKQSRVASPDFIVSATAGMSRVLYPPSHLRNLTSDVRLCVGVVEVLCKR